MLFISVMSEEVDERTFNNADGTSRTVRRQKAYAHVPEQDFPVPCPLSLEPGQAAYRAGEYVADGSSYRFNAKGKVELNIYDLNVIPIAQAVDALKNWQASRPAPAKKPVAAE